MKQLTNQVSDKINRVKFDDKDFDAKIDAQLKEISEKIKSTEKKDSKVVNIYAKKRKII